MFLTTLCYIEKDDCYLMLHRVKKENDLNHDKWIGVGGKFEAEEMPEECMMREVKEETGLTDILPRAGRHYLYFQRVGHRIYAFIYGRPVYRGDNRLRRGRTCLGSEKGNQRPETVGR